MCEITEQIERHGRAVGRAEGRAEVRAEGRAEGKAAGKTEGKRTMALNLAQAGMPADMIAKIAEESISVVQRWIAADAAPGMK